MDKQYDNRISGVAYVLLYHGVYSMRLNLVTKL